MAQTPQTQSGKELRALLSLPRSPAKSYIRMTQHHYKLAPLTWRGMVTWVSQYLGNRFGFRHRFPNYDGAEDTGIYRLGDDSVIGGRPDRNGEIRVGLAGDWGTGTDEAAEVARHIEQSNPHYTIHLGDVYYVGSEVDVNENCLGIQDPTRNIVPNLWPVGSVGSFALNGNHEMYALGRAYFDTFLPRLGMRVSPGEAPMGQKASFFCLQNDHWMIIGLDTGYNSIGIPILEEAAIIPVLGKIGIFSPSCKLPGSLLRWIRDQVKPNENKRGIILLSHHQYCSAFDRVYLNPAIQLRKMIDRPVLWLWGHEHCMAIYKKYKTRRGIEAYGRCIGHGGMPVARRPTVILKEPLVLYDNRRYPSDEGIDVGYNGFATLIFKGTQLTVDYRDLRNSQLVTERWEVSDGVPIGKDIRVLSQDQGLAHVADVRSAIS